MGARVARRDVEPESRSRFADASPTLDAALVDLDRLMAARPELSAAAGSLATVLIAAFRAPVPEIALHAEPELLVEAWRAGVPAFHAGEAPLGVHSDDLRARAGSLAEALRAINPGAAPLLKALQKGQANPDTWAVEALAGRPEVIDADACNLGIDPALARSIVRLGLLPQLSAHSEKLATIRPSGIWSGGNCPNCGGAPTLAESRGLEQRRYWRCGVCAADWPGERVRCPFCGETDHSRLRYRFVEGEQDRYRLTVCDACRGRLKVTSTLGPLSLPGLLVAELATAHLDGIHFV
jgi:hypothetical protein